MKIVGLAGVFFGVVLLLSQQAIADDADVEYKVKAGYLYNFTKFIIWPEDKSETFNLCGEKMSILTQLSYTQE